MSPQLLHAGSAPLWRLSAHDAPACSLTFSPAAPTLMATASTDKKVHFDRDSLPITLGRFVTRSSRPLTLCTTPLQVQCTLSLCPPAAPPRMHCSHPSDRTSPPAKCVTLARTYLSCAGLAVAGVSCCPAALLQALCAARPSAAWVPSIRLPLVLKVPSPCTAAHRLPTACQRMYGTLVLGAGPYRRRTDELM